jgi:hypothetical protein
MTGFVLSFAFNYFDSNHFDFDFSGLDDFVPG